MRSKRSKRNRYVSEDMKSLEVPSRVLQKLSYQDLKNLSSEELHKYKRRVGIIDQEGNSFTDEELIRMLRKYISGKKGFTTRRDIKRKSKRKKKKTQKGAGRKLKKIKKRSHKMNQTSNSVRGKNKALEKLWTDMSNMKKYVFIMKDGSYQIKSVEPSYKGQRGSRFMEKYCLPMIEKANNDDSVKMILSAGNSYDGYEQLYDDVGNSSVDQVLKDYKKYWKYQIDDKLYTC